MHLLPFFTVLFIAVCIPCAAQPTIAEFLTENSSGITDQDGDRSDWIEIHNPYADPVNLSGWSLTDDAGATEKMDLSRHYASRNGISHHLCLGQGPQ